MIKLIAKGFHRLALASIDLRRDARQLKVPLSWLYFAAEYQQSLVPFSRPLNGED
nr:hypothetical protein [Thalassotalea euphylliae]